jgi:sugar/nucleoside kinase (ribokinase family)
VAGGATVAITAGAGATQVLSRHGEIWEPPAEPLPAPVDDLGAGDVYAAALFVHLAAGDDAAAAARVAHAAAALRMLGIGPDAIASGEAIAANARALAPPPS